MVWLSGTTLSADISAALPDAKAWPFEEARKLIKRLDRLPDGKEKTRASSPLRLRELATDSAGGDLPQNNSRTVSASDPRLEPFRFCFVVLLIGKPVHTFPEAL